MLFPVLYAVHAPDCRQMLLFNGE